MSGGNDIAHEKLAREGIYTGTHWEEGAKRRQIAPEHAALVKAMFNIYNRIERQFGHPISSFGYLEAHIKGLKLEDIESINIPKGFTEGILVGTVEQGDYKALIEKLLQDPQWKGKINIIE
jgi:hypothetical protein